MSTQRKKTPQESIAIESTMKAIETLLEKLENSDTPLDQSLTAFEEGIKLIRTAQNTLSEAEQKVQILIEKDGTPVIKEANFDENNG